jgi:hypothetical protein
MKFQDISNTTTAAEAARQALRRQSIIVDENLGGRKLREQLEIVKSEIDSLASRGGVDYTRAVLHKEIYEDLANVDAVLFEADLDDADLEQAEVVLAAQSMSKQFQGMIEDVADMLGSDMIALVDQIKAKFGDGAGEQFGQTVKTTLESAIDTLTQSKDSIDSAITGLTNPMAAPAVDAGELDMGGEEEAPVFPSSSGPEEEPTGREIKSDVE